MAVERISIVIGTIFCGLVASPLTVDSDSSMPYTLPTTYTDSSGGCDLSSVNPAASINGIVLQYVFLLTIPVLGLTQATGIAVATAFGAGRRKWARQIGDTAVGRWL